jgi:tetratricopeptide (TPR) repeat protein
MALKVKPAALIVGLMLVAGQPAVMAQLSCGGGLDYLGQGRMAQQGGDFTAAVNAFTCALAVNPADAAARAGLLEAHLLAGSLSEAIIQAGRLRDLDPAGFAARHAEYTAAITANPADTRARQYLMVLNWVDARDEAVIQDANAVLMAEPQNATALILRASSYQFLGDPFNPMVDLQNALNIGGQDADAYSILGSTFFQTGDEGSAYPMIDQALMLDASDARAYYFRGRLWLEERNYARAIADFTTAISYDPQYYDAFYDRGRANALSGNLPAAQADFSNALTYFPAFKLAFRDRGNVQEWQGNAAGAAPDYAQYVRLNTRLFYPPQAAAPGTPAMVSIQPNDAAQLTFTLAAGQAITITAEGSGVDPVLVLLAPDSTVLAGSDDPQMDVPSPVIQGFVAPADGTYTLQIASSDTARAGQGTVSVMIR